MKPDSTEDVVITRPHVASAPETTGFFEFEGSRVFATTHTADESTAGVVICPSLFTEALRNYRRETLLARALVERGLAAQRFHYRGTGNSDDVDRMTFQSLCDDGRFAASQLRRGAGTSKLAYFGTRFGAIVAAALAGDDPGAPLVMIEPVLDGRRFCKEGLRAKAMSGFRSTRGGSTVKDLSQELEAEGVVDILGDELTLSLYDSLEGVTLSSVQSMDARPILLVQLGSEEGVRREYEQLVTGWTDAGCDVEVASVGERSAWWFLDERDPVGVGAMRSAGFGEADALVTIVLSWLSSRLGSSEDS